MKKRLFILKKLVTLSCMLIGSCLCTYAQNDDGNNSIKASYTAYAKSSRITPTGVTLAFGQYSSWPSSGFGETVSFATTSSTGWYVNCQMSDDFEFIGWTSFFEVNPSTGIGIAPTYGGTDANHANGEIGDLLTINQTTGWNSTTGKDIYKLGFKVGNNTTGHGSNVPFRHFNQSTVDTIWAVALLKDRYIKLNDNDELNVTTQSTQFVMKRMCVPFEVTLSLSGTNAGYFEISLDGNSWSSTITVPKDYKRTEATTVKEKTLYVRIKEGTPEGTYSATLQASSMYMNNLNTTPAYTPPETVGNKAIELSATVLPTPTLSLTGMATSISEVQIGEATVSGSNLIGNSVIVSLEGTNANDFEISETGTGNWNNSITYNIVGSSNINKTFYVHIKETVMGKKSLSATLKAETTGAVPATKIINGTVTPTLTVPTTTISWQGLAAQSFSINGTRLSGNDVTVSTTSTSTPTSDFEISQDKDSWSSSVQVSGTNVNSGVTLYVRMKNSLTPGSHSGSISVETSDVDGSKSFALDGTLSEIWQDNITEAPDHYQAASINTPEAFVWCLKRNDNGTLTQDVDLSKFIWNPISNFSGTFNGNGHVITGLTNKKDGSPVTDPGLFASITTGATVKNIIVKDCEFGANKPDNFFGIIANEMTGGTVSGCMVVSGSLTGSGKFGGIVGQLNGGTVHSCISQVAPASGGSIVHTISGGLLRNSFTNAGSKLYINKGREDSNVQNCVYKDGSWKYVKPDGSEAAITIQGFDYGEKGCVYSGSTERLVDVLNKYAKDHSYTLWAQPLTTSINSGVPVMKLEDKNTVVQNDDDLDYGDLENYLSAGKAMLFYGKGETSTAYSGDNLYIDEDAALIVTANVKAHTSRFIANLTSKEETEIWHHYSSPVDKAATGITYKQTGIMQPNASCEPQLSAALFPSGIGNETTDLVKWDLYSYYEPAFHWLNFKRNSSSHYQNGDAPQRIVLVGDLLDQDYLRNGEGYLIAMASSSYIQSNGTLNHGNITRPVKVTNLSATVGAGLEGLNLLGNPYQSYLSFSVFAVVNKALWNDNADAATYLVYNPNDDKYTQGTMETTSTGSDAATGVINMHQGFFIVAKASGTATFTDAMRSLEPDNADVHFRDGEKMAYPLINLVARDAEGVGDVAVVEFDRPEFAAAPKIFNYGGKGKVFFHYENNDNALLFLDEETDQLPVRFAAFEDGDYTIEWSTANADFSYLHLIDNMTGNDIDMLARDSYSFAAKTTDYTSRFRLVFSYTGIGEENATEPARTFAFVHDGNLVVNGQGHMQVIDLNGRTVVTRQLTGEQNTVSLPNVAPGVYVIRLADSKESKVQKIIIK